MTRFPSIRIQGWHHDGPVYQIHRSLTGRRNRHARRRGETGIEQFGHPGGRNVEEAAAFMVFAKANDELYAFNAGHVYEIEQLVDGESSIIHVDAREDYELHAFTGGIELLEWRALDEDELAALLEDQGLADPDEPRESGAVGDPSESQEPHPGALSVTDLSGSEPVSEPAPAAPKLERPAPPEQPPAPAAEQPAHEPVEPPSDDEGDEPSEAPEVPEPVADQELDEHVAQQSDEDEPEDDLRARVAEQLDVPVEELAEFDRAQLEQLEPASAETSTADGEDVIGGDDGKPSADEAE